MEQLLHYCWKHKIFPLRELKTTDGRSFEVLNPGLHNTDAGPDFLDAKVKIDGIVWVGNVEIHVRASDWHRHRHDGNPAYENIILHVVGVEDEKLSYYNGQAVPQFVLTVPRYVADNYDHLLLADKQPPCKDVLADFPRLLIHSWLASLQVERLEMRTQQIMEGLASADGIDDVELARTCTALRVIPDALPSKLNKEATLASMNQLLNWSNNGSGIESISSGEASGGSIGDGLTVDPIGAIAKLNKTLPKYIAPPSRPARFDSNVQLISLALSLQK